MRETQLKNGKIRLKKCLITVTIYIKGLNSGNNRNKNRKALSSPFNAYMSHSMVKTVRGISNIFKPIKHSISIQQVVRLGQTSDEYIKQDSRRIKYVKQK